MQRGLKAASMYPIIGALRFFYRTTPPAMMVPRGL
jgi:hypothetical protein